MWLDITALETWVRKHVGDMTFQEAYDSYKWILNITVTSLSHMSNNRVLNYLTDPTVMIWSACCASSAIPRIYAPVKLKCKDENGNVVEYIDSCK